MGEIRAFPRLASSDDPMACTQCGMPLGRDFDGRQQIPDPLLPGRYAHPLCWFTIVNTALKVLDP